MGIACGSLLEMEITDGHHRDFPFILKAVDLQTFFSSLGVCFFLSLVLFSNHLQLYISPPLKLCYLVARSLTYLFNTETGPVGNVL